MKEVSVYIFTGMLDSGKTTLINKTLLTTDITEGFQNLLICCEEGENEFDKDSYAKKNTFIEILEFG